MNKIDEKLFELQQAIHDEMLAGNIPCTVEPDSDSWLGTFKADVTEDVSLYLSLGNAERSDLCSGRLSSYIRIDSKLYSEQDIATLRDRLLRELLKDEAYRNAELAKRTSAISKLQSEIDFINSI